MKLTLNEIKNKSSWETLNIQLPQYDVEKMRNKTVEAPKWIHFGAGNIFRGFIAGLQECLLNTQAETTGIIAADTFDYDMLDKIYEPFDNLVLNVGLKEDGNKIMAVYGAIAENVKADFSNLNCYNRLLEIVTDPGLEIISFTITEKGYALNDMSGAFLKVVEADIENGPEKSKHAMSIVTALLYHRFKKNAAPIALCSMDNCSHNGEKLKNSVLTIADEWQKKGYVSSEFIEYINNEEKVAFPWSMIDKITPRPSREIAEELTNLGIEEMEPIITNKNTFIAPFVNAEIPQYLVIEDRFPNGRPCLEKAGVYFTDRDTVNNTEKMKVTTCLNPLHTAMAVFGCLLGYNHIATEMKDEDVSKLVNFIGYKEGLPVVTDPKIISPKAFLDEVINKRLPNMFIPDMPQRIATDTSMKVPIRFGETIKSYAYRDEFDVKSLTYIPLAIAAWMRYLLGIDDAGKKMEVSSDPRLEELQAKLSDIKYDDVSSYNGQLKEILSNENIFSINLCEIGIAEKIEEMFKEMLNGKGCVRTTLHKYVG